MPDSFSFVALGDMPYFEPDHATFAALIDRINALAPRFCLHVGDLKTAKTPCDAACYRRVLDHFGRFEQPLIYTPGDNDWADCIKDSAGGFDALERLDEIRRTFFARPRSLGRSPMALERQGDGPSHPDMVENARWRIEDTLFLTVHNTGDNNNLGRDPSTDREYDARNDANLQWIEEGFAEANGSGLNGLVIVTHANLWIERDLRPKRRYKDKHQQEGFRPTIKTIRRGAKRLGRPVLVVHGDKHRFTVDQPLTVSKSDDLPLDTVTRLQVMGAELIDAVVVTVDPSSPALFSFSRLLG